VRQHTTGVGRMREREVGKANGRGRVERRWRRGGKRGRDEVGWLGRLAWQ
jgi:hypothetical protein